MVLVEPTRERVIEFCAQSPIERVFLEDVARRGLGRFVAAEDTGGRLEALCHVGANLVPSGVGCGRFSASVSAATAKMIIGEARAVGDLWDAARATLPAVREDRPGQPVYAINERPPEGDTGLRAATASDLDILVPACAAAHQLELGIDPLARDGDGFRWRTSAQIDEGRSWVWLEDGVVLFKAEASAWTPSAVQLQQVWTDPKVRLKGYARRGLCDLIRLLLDHVPTVTLFVRAENAPAIGLYEAIGMRHILDYRSVLF
jgi:ribosomal protein S18 acetylase RimI-like enzyme